MTNLDILRSIAVVAVLAAHWALTLSGNGPDQRVAFGVDVYALGGAGVLIFFVHTSLVLMMSLQRSSHNGLRLYWSFYLRRFFRIYPLSILLCLTVVACSIPRSGLDTHYSWPGKFAILSNLTLTQNITGVQPLSNPLWSLPYEVQMYLLLPAIFVFVVAKRWPLRLALLMAVAVLAANYLALAAFVPNFLCGVLAYCLLQTVRPRLPAWLCPMVILGAAAGYCILSSGQDSSLTRNTALTLILGTTLPLFKDAGYRPVQLVAHNIAKYSYGIYLVHFPLLWVFYRKLGGLPPAGQHLGFIASLMILPVMCFHLVEQPMIRFGAWLSSHRLLLGQVQVNLAGSSQLG